MSLRRLFVLVTLALALATVGFVASASAGSASVETSDGIAWCSWDNHDAVSAKDYGKCSFNSDCHPGVKCNSGRCADAAGSKCSFNSDCGGKGAKCNSGKCSNAPDGKCNFNSECPGGRCSSGKCVF